MKERADAFALAEEMMAIGTNAGRRMMAVVSDMDQPLGRAVGNALEVKEAIATLRGKGPNDFTQLCMSLGGCMLLAAGIAQDEGKARDMLEKVIEGGSALAKLSEFVNAQGGNGEMVYHPELLPKASLIVPVESPKDGFVHRITCDEVGICSLILGGGRQTKESSIDLSVGIVLEKKVGDFVKKGEPLAYIHANGKEQCRAGLERLLSAYEISESKRKEGPVILGVLKQV